MTSFRKIVGALDLTKVIGLLTFAIDGLDVIASATSNIKDDKAVMALKTVQAVLTTIENFAAGKIGPDDVRAAYAKLTADLAANDKSADEKLAKKYGKK
jgi:hypothetical protein